MTKLEQMKPDQVCAWIKQKIRERYGDKAENKSNVWASHGFYYVLIYQGRKGKRIEYTEFTLRRKNLPALFKSLK